jgi:hypothetical protein
MKKLLLLFVVLTYGSTQLATAQQGRQFDPAAMKERQKTKLKEDLKLTDAQADSVAAIQFEYMPKLRSLRELKEDERLTKMKEINDAYKTRLKTALNDDKLLDKVLLYQEEQRKQRMERMRGGE